MLFQPPQSGKAADLFSPEQELQSMLDVEAALARAEARCGLIPQFAAVTIAEHCRATLFDLASLSAASTRGGNSAIPLIAELTRIVAATSPEAAGFVHWGATSQDIIDSGLILRLRTFLDDLDLALVGLGNTLASLVEVHGATPIAGRTWMQHAVPTTFGLKLAGTLDAVSRHRERLSQLRPRLLTLQFGGAAGTLASLGSRGVDVAHALAAELNLAVADVPWHTQRDRIVELASFCGVISITVGKLARDLTLLSQTEIAEVAEPQTEDSDGSSTMPHKRNPVALGCILSATLRVPGLISTLHIAAMHQENERGMGGWPLEWSVLPDLCVTTQSALETLTRALAGLVVNTHVMREHLDRTGGLLLAEAVGMALAERLGKPQAHRLVQELTRTPNFRDALLADATVREYLTHAQIDALLDPANYLGSAQQMVASVLTVWRRKGSG